MSSLNQNGRMSVAEHLEELRRRLIVIALGVAVGTAGGWFLVPFVLHLLLAPVRQAGASLIQLSATEVFWVYLRLAVVLGVVLASPLIIQQALAFVWPALEPREKRFVLASLPAVVLLFAGGLAFAFFLILPWAFRFFLGFTLPGVTPTLSVGSYISFLLNLTLPFGLVAQMPVLVAILGKLGLVSPAFLRRHRKFAVLAIFILAALLTPPDPVSQLVMAVPMLALYEVSVLLARLTAPRP